VEVTPDKQRRLLRRTVEGAPRAYYHANGDRDRNRQGDFYGETLQRRIWRGNYSDDGRYQFTSLFYGKRVGTDRCISTGF